MTIEWNEECIIDRMLSTYVWKRNLFQNFYHSDLDVIMIDSQFDDWSTEVKILKGLFNFSISHYLCCFGTSEVVKKVFLLFFSNHCYQLFRCTCVDQIYFSRTFTFASLFISFILLTINAVLRRFERNKS